MTEHNTFRHILFYFFFCLKVKFTNLPYFKNNKIKLVSTTIHDHQITNISKYKKKYN